MSQYLVKEATDLLQSIIRIPSFSRKEEEVADFLQTTIESYGLESHRKGNNIWTICPHLDPNKPTILLNSHQDTVYPVDAWKRQPFTPLVEGDRLYGLGSNDAGASLVSLLSVFRVLTSKEQPYNLIYLASCEEEVSGKDGIELVIPELPPISFLIVGEPTKMLPAIAEKGLMVLDVMAHGTAGHAARDEGVNAIYQALEDIKWFSQYKFDKTSALLGDVKMTVTQIEAGTQHNVIPDQCKYVVDVRSNECYSNEELFSVIKEHIADSDVTARSFRLNSSKIEQSHPFVQRCIEAGLVPYGSPTLSDQALLNIPSLKMGPGDSARSHTADEYICFSEIEAAIPLYISLLDDLRF